MPASLVLAEDTVFLSTLLPCDALVVSDLALAFAPPLLLLLAGDFVGTVDPGLSFSMFSRISKSFQEQDSFLG